MLDRTPDTVTRKMPQAAVGIRLNRTRQRRRAVLTWAAGIAVILLAAIVAGASGAEAAPLMMGTVSCAAIWCLLADRWMRNTGGIPILVWHSVSRDAAWLPWAANIAVTPETLERQMKLLRKMGCISMDTVDFVSRRLRGATVPANTVILHFDDGYLDNWVAAAPILERHGQRGTIFVSLDFIAPDRPRPPTMECAGARWDGYLSWSEIRALERGAFRGAFGIEAHGVDHGRLPTTPRTVDYLTPDNWRRLAWMQWAHMPGNKHDWYVHTDPPAVGYGTAVPESGAALAGPAWIGSGCEDSSSYAARVRGDLRACRDEFERHLGRAPRIFCWPQNQTSDVALQIAADEGFWATTGGQGCNHAGEDPAILSRIHVGERVAGFSWAAADDLFFRASIHAFRGNHWWYLPMAALSGLRRIVQRLPGQRARP